MGPAGARGSDGIVGPEGKNNRSLKNIIRLNFI